MTHWHAYAWTGHERPPESDRINPQSETPPLEIAHWLRKTPRAMRGGTLHDVEAACDWLKGEITEHPKPPRSQDNRPADEVALEYARDCLERGTDVVWGYWSQQMRYVSRALITCPREGYACPSGR